MEEGEPGKKEANWFTWAARAAKMRNMHGREAMKAWTSDSAAKHIPVLKDRGNNNNKINVFQGHWDHASLGNGHAGTHPDSE